MILAGIDIGTNSLRLLVAETGPESFREIHSDRRITRLGEGLDRTGLLSGDARERSIAALSDFRDLVGKSGAAAVSAVGTSALRNALNSTVFLRQARERTGLDVRIIEGSEEARLTLLGVSRALDAHTLQPRTMVIDIGGGSTEIISIEPAFEASLSLGAVYLTERFLRHDPPLTGELDLLRREIRSILRSSLPPSLHAAGLVGTAGTITTLASMAQQLTHYDPARINGARLSRDRIGETVESLSRSSLGERRKLPGLEPGREDIILAGAMVLQEIMDLGNFHDLLVSDWGLREGIVIDLYGKMIKKEQLSEGT
jgi:exopolyphosphatase/guanosine-5'-triphosphate,3'-diphosphate pyrophosphatase